MRVAFIGNMNNQFFAVVRHLRALGVDAHLLLHDNEFPHFHPSFDTFDLSYRSYTHQLSWGDHLGFSAVPSARVRAELKDFDVLVGCGATPGFVHRAGMQLDAFIPYGYDITEYPFFLWVPPHRNALSSPLRFPHHQRQGIREARFILGAWAPPFERTFDALKCKGQRIASPIPPIYANECNPTAIQQFYDRSTWYQDFLAVRKRHDLVVMHHGRHIWKSKSSPIEPKGNDKLVRGFKAFTDKHPDVRACMVFVEYGPDVNATRALCEELGISDRVFWFPLMPRKEAMIGVSLADIVVGELSVSWIFGGSIVEGLAMAKPLLHHRNDEEFPADELYPIMKVHSAEDVGDALGRYVASPDEHKKIGADAHQWFQDSITRVGLARFQELLGVAPERDGLPAPQTP